MIKAQARKVYSSALFPKHWAASRKFLINLTTQKRFASYSAWICATSELNPSSMNPRCFKLKLCSSSVRLSPHLSTQRWWLLCLRAVLEVIYAKIAREERVRLAQIQATDDDNHPVHGNVVVFFFEAGGLRKPSSIGLRRRCEAAKQHSIDYKFENVQHIQTMKNATPAW